MERTYIDFHCHILHSMDFDGTKDIEVSEKMCDVFKSQGVAAICATPHFYPWQEDIDTFISRRNTVLSELKRSYGGIEIIAGAEVRLFSGLCDLPADRMCLGTSNVILLELSDEPFGERIIASIENTVFKYSLIPMIAHVERYGLNQKQLSALASIPRTVFQISAECFADRRRASEIESIFSVGVPVVVGSDAHNMDNRKPNFDIFVKKAESKPSIIDFNGKRLCTMAQKCLNSQEYLKSLIYPKA